MPQDLVTQAGDFLHTYVLPFGWKFVGAIAVITIGSAVIKLLRHGLSRALVARKVDVTLARYVEAGASGFLRLLLFIVVLSVLGIETTSFAALLAALGIAIGAAWGGLLANLAAGIFLLILRPFKVGDLISAAGVTGTVRSISLFSASLDTGENVRVHVGNNKLFSDSIFNYSTNPSRRVDVEAQLAHSVDPRDAVRRLKERVATIPNVLADPAPSIEILKFNQWGTLLCVRPFCHTDHYWQVYFDTNQAIAEIGAAAKYAIPEQYIATRAVS